jgi:hypothetical protein
MFNVYKRFTVDLYPVKICETRRQAIEYCQNQEPETDLGWSQVYRIDEYPKPEKPAYKKKKKSTSL